MRFYLGLPTDHVSLGDEFISAAGIAAVARAAEAAGFHGVFSTEHPFPADDWLASGGHQAIDPFVALSFAAAATTRLEILSYVCVLPYRNPFLAAKSAASLQAVSGGRFVFGVGAGYMEGEFRALGVDYQERNELMDEGLIAIRAAWTEEGVRFEGRSFRAEGNTMLPRPEPPPIWVGGNSKRALRRAAHLGDGWMPMLNPRALGDRRRSTHLETLDDLRGMMTYLRSERAASGRPDPMDVLAMPMAAPGGSDVQRLADHVADLAAVGVTSLAVTLPAPDRRTAVENIAHYGADVLPLLVD